MRVNICVNNREDTAPSPVFCIPLISSRGPGVSCPRCSWTCIPSSCRVCVCVFVSTYMEQPVCVCVCVCALSLSQHSTIMRWWNLPACSNSCILSHTRGLKRLPGVGGSQGERRRHGSLQPSHPSARRRPSPVLSGVAERRTHGETRRAHGPGWSFGMCEQHSEGEGGGRKVRDVCTLWKYIYEIKRGLIQIKSSFREDSVGFL